MLRLATSLRLASVSFPVIPDMAPRSTTKDENKVTVKQIFLHIIDILESYNC